MALAGKPNHLPPLPRSLAVQEPLTFKCDYGAMNNIKCLEKDAARATIQPMKKMRHAKLFALKLSLLMFAMYPGFGNAEQISNRVLEVTYLPSNPVVNRGDSKEHVDKLLGASKGWKADNEETAYYERGYVVFRDGKAAKWSILNDAELLNKKEREQQDDNHLRFRMTQDDIPRSSPAEIAYRRQLEQKQQEDRRQEAEIERENYKKNQSWQPHGQQSAQEARGMANYRNAGLSRAQYEEDAAFVRNLVRESKIPVRRDAYDISASQPEVQSYANSVIPMPQVEIGQQSYVTVEPTAPNVGVSMVPSSHGGMVIGGPMGGSILPGSQGGMVIGGPMGGTILPGSHGGMVIGGPMGGSILPDSQGGMVIGGSMGGSILPGSKGGMVIGGPMGGTILPGSKGGMVIGGPLNGSLMPGQ
jgi:hypothetical protein